ncbi:MAG: DEAD/DEAH box helicase [Candidatus Woesearchaeota archaeon]|nr:DEAD/DEAH box helicase [Candidatus Woesearchaeota archaeon]
MEYKGKILDKFQEDAIAAIEKNHSVVVSAPTGSGKTLIADYIINTDHARGIRVVYTAPIKALSNQKYKEFCADYGEKNVGMLTGDVVKNPDAPILIMTTEIYRNMAIIRDPMLDNVSYVVFDEIHYINDIERGYVWEESVIFSPPEVRFVCLSATIPNADEFAQWIESISKHPVKVIRHEHRSVPLEKKFFDVELGVTTLEHIRDVKDVPDYKHVFGKQRNRRERVPGPSHVDLVSELLEKEQVPCFFFVFSRKKTQEWAHELSKKNWFKINPDIIHRIRVKLENVSPEVKNLESTRLLRHVLPMGIGFHHAGLIPIQKELVEELFGDGLLKILYTTETFAVGINMPAKTVCFESLRKFDGIQFRLLNSKEYFQIAGRAGRRGIDKEGFAYAMVDRREFDYAALKRITLVDTEPIKSQFRLSINTTLNLIKRHSPQEIDLILCKNFYTYQKYKQNFDTTHKGVVHHTFGNLKKKLEKLGYVDGNTLTEKGDFGANIYSEEILTTEIFSTSFYPRLDEYQTLLMVASICYEHRERTQFRQLYPSPPYQDLMHKINTDPYLSKEKRFGHLKELTAFVHPCYHGDTIFDILLNTNLQEGDLIRLFRQMMDRMNQIKMATRDMQLRDRMENCQRMVIACLKDIDAV